MFRVFLGDTFDESAESVWASPDAEYAAAYAQLHEAPLWRHTLDVSENEVLDLTDCGLDVVAVVGNLRFAGIPASSQAGEDRNPQMVLRRVSTDAISDRRLWRDSCPGMD